MDKKIYLERLGVESKVPSLEYLNELIVSHQKTISFNNLAVFFNPGRLLNLELEPLFEKVIAQGGGGYCFENNKIFHYLLKDLGFQVEAKAARVLYGYSGDRPRTHRTNIVTLGSTRYLVDVGFGKDMPGEAFKIADGYMDDNYRISKKGSDYYLQLLKNEEYFDLYTFDDGHYQETDFFLGNYYSNTYPDSKFVKELIVVLKKPEIVHLINGDVYSRIEENVREDIKIIDQADFQERLKLFGINQHYDFGFLKSIGHLTKI